MYEHSEFAHEFGYPCDACIWEHYCETYNLDENGNPKEGDK